MNLMISENISRPALERTHANAAIDTISYAISACALGELLVARSVKGVCAILMGSTQDELDADLAARFPEANLIGNEAVVYDDLAKVISFIDMPADGFYLRSRQPVRWLALAPPIRSRWLFPVTASCAAMAIWRATGGASSASVK